MYNDRDDKEWFIKSDRRQEKKCHNDIKKQRRVQITEILDRFVFSLNNIFLFDKIIEFTLK